MTEQQFEQKIEIMRANHFARFTKFENEFFPIKEAHPEIKMEKNLAAKLFEVNMQRVLVSGLFQKHFPEITIDKIYDHMKSRLRYRSNFEYRGNPDINVSYEKLFKIGLDKLELEIEQLR